MRAAIYNPYLDTLGGGERYTLSFAKVLLDQGWSVNLQWPEETIKEKLAKRFGIDISGINIVSDIKKGSGYDLCFWVSDGSVPLLSARKNILHFQVPFRNQEGRSLLNKMKFFRINKVVCNSKFVKKIIDAEYGVKSVVLYPPVDVAKIKPKRKENIILYVGRFSQLAQAKRQDILIKAFKRLQTKSWRLVLAGGVEVGVGDYLDKLKKDAKGYPIEIKESPSFREIITLYGKAKIFWSAAGYGVNVRKNPEKVEHFGLTTVEAMAGGAVPVVFAAGGQKEIVRDGANGFLWKETGELVNLTKKLIQEKKLLQNLAGQARVSSLSFAYEKFAQRVLAL